MGHTPFGQGQAQNAACMPRCRAGVRREGKRLGPGENSKERHSGLEETAGVRSLRQDGSGDSMDGMRKGVNLHQDTEHGKARKVLEQG